LLAYLFVCLLACFSLLSLALCSFGTRVCLSRLLMHNCHAPISPNLPRPRVLRTSLSLSLSLSLFLFLPTHRFHEKWPTPTPLSRVWIAVVGNREDSRWTEIGSRLGNFVKLCWFCIYDAFCCVAGNARPREACRNDAWIIIATTHPIAVAQIDLFFILLNFTGLFFFSLYTR
jgi:hypothetical protein